MGAKGDKFMDTALNEFLIDKDGFVYATLYIKPLNDVTMVERRFLLDTNLARKRLKRITRH